MLILSLFQVNGIKKGSLLVPSEVCNPLNHNHLQVEAVKGACEQNILTSPECATKIFVARNGQIVNFVVK